MLEINKSDLKNPSECGWYLCKYSRSSVTYFKNENNSRDVDYCLCNCILRILYWENNVWLSSPRSYNVIENGNVLSWCKVHNDYNIYDETIKVLF
jgi:hypothetical protein